MLRYLVIVFLFFCGSIYPQTKVNNIEFEGYEFFGYNDLINSMGLKKDLLFSKTQFEADLKSIREKYRTEGFLFAKIEDARVKYFADSSYADIYIKISEGDRVITGKITLEGNNSLSSERLKRVMSSKEGEVLNGNTLNNDLVSILNEYEKEGNLFAKAVIEDISVYNDNGGKKLSVKIRIIEENKIKINNIRITGNDVTDNVVITRELRINNDKTITRENLKAMKSRLEKLNIFERVDEPVIYTIKNKNESGLLINVTEGNTNTFDGVLGYVPPVSEGESGYFTGLVNLSFRNLFGTARRLDARWQQETKKTQELEIKYAEPYFFNLPLNLGIAFMQRLQDSSYTRRKFDLKGDIIITDKFTAGFSGGLDRVIPPDDSLLVFNVSDSRILYAGVDIKFDSRDNIFIPESGIVYRASYTYGNKKVYSRNPSNISGEKDYNLQRYSMDIDWYSSFAKRQSALVRFFIGQVTSAKLEDADFYKVGGIKNIRGYRDEQFRASIFTYGTIELRYSFSRRGFFSLFADPGYYYRPDDEPNSIPSQQGFLLGYGAGIRIETAIGIIGVNYAIPKGSGFLDGVIHFGLINEF